MMTQSENEKYNRRAIKNLYRDILKLNYKIVKVTTIYGDLNYHPLTPYRILRQGTNHIIIEIDKLITKIN